jgi:hypothetical protein
LFNLHENLFHYTKAGTLLERILPSMTLKMGTYEGLNDPRESKTWPFTLYSKKLSTNDSFQSSLFDEISDFITKKTIVLCGTRDDPDVTDNSDDRDFRSGYGHPRMWAQYADSHKGVCLVVDHGALHKNIVQIAGDRPFFHGPVNYLSSSSGPNDLSNHITYIEDIYENGLSNTIEPHLRKNNESLFFTKHLDWRDEWEHRWIIRSEEEKAEYVSITNCLKAVILGGECDLSNQSEILKACNILEIPVFKIFQHGWSMSLMPLEDNTVRSLNGISYSTEIPTTGVFTQARDTLGSVKLVLIKNNREVSIVE